MLNYQPSPVHAPTVNPSGFGFDWGPVASHRGPRQIVAFYWKSEVDRQASIAEGRPVFVKVEFVTIQMPGEITQIIDRPVKEEDKFRWPNEYHAHQQSTAYIPDGTPVEFLFTSQPQIVATLKSFGVHVIEDLVTLNPNGMQTIGMGCQEWVNKGKAYLESAKSGVSFHQMEDMRQKHERETAALTNQITDLKRQYEGLVHEMRLNTPQYASDAIAQRAAFANAPVPPTPHTPSIPNMPAGNPTAWAAPDPSMHDATQDRRDAIKSKLRSQQRAAGAKDDGVTFKED